MDFDAMMDELNDAEQELKDKKNHQVDVNPVDIESDLKKPKSNSQATQEPNLKKAVSNSSFKVKFAGADGHDVLEYDETEPILQTSVLPIGSINRFPSTSSISSQKSILKRPSQVVVPDILPMDPNLPHEDEFNSTDSSSYGSDQYSETDSDEDNTPLGMRFGGSVQMENECATLSMLDEYMTDGDSITSEESPELEVPKPKAKHPYFALQEGRTVITY